MRHLDDPRPHRSDAVPLDDLIATRLHRRQVLGGGLAALALGLVGGSGVLRAAPASAASGGATAPGKAARGNLLGFTPVLPSSADDFVVPEGYTWQVLVPWGTPLFGDAAEWREDASNSAADQERQVGFNHDGMHYFPLDKGPKGSRRGLLVVNHEYTDANQLYSAAQGKAITDDAAGREKVAKALAAHGVTVVEIRQGDDGSWSHVVGSKYNRRITGNTVMHFGGPISVSHPMLQSELGNRELGTLNNCAMGYTPWGTYLACEENWNGYFGTDAPGWTPTDAEARYGVSAAGFGYQWHKAEPRFDLAKNRKELNRFGWVVEIDPFDPTSAPVKRTALGRIKHEGATVTEMQGHVVVYSGDDEDGDYLYKFVGSVPWRKLRAHRQSPLDHGTLFVARFHEDGTGEWLPLKHGEGPLVADGPTPATSFVDQADVLLRTRQAADAVGATPLHRPEWISVDERTGDVYLTLTNGSVNKTAAVNGNRTSNPYGHIIRFRETGGSIHNQKPFAWEVFLYAGDPLYDGTGGKADLGGGDVPDDQPLFGSPDGVWVDPDGRVWIQTDVSNSSQNLASRGYDRIGNNQMLVADPDTGEVKRFLTGPRGCELTGVITTPDQRTMFVNVQHPGESTTFWNAQSAAPSPANPRTVSNWPEFSATGRPRPCTVAIRKLDGGVIGS